MADLAWVELNPANALPAGVEGAFDAIKGAIATIETALAAVKAVYEVVKVFVVDRVDILETVLSSIRDSVSAIIETLEEAGVYALVYLPKTPFTGPRPTVWINRVMASMQDLGDPNRPEFTTPQGQVGALVMVAAPDIASVMEKASPLVGAFLRPAKVKLEYPTEEEIQAEYGTNVNRGRGKTPDWEKPVRLRELVPPLASLSAVLKKVLGLLVFGAGLTQLIDDYIAFLDAKIAVLQALGTELDDVQGEFQALLAITDANVLFWEGTYTTDTLAEAVAAAGLPTSIEGDDDNLLAAGFALVAAGDPSTEISETAALLKGLLGAA